MKEIIIHHIFRYDRSEGNLCHHSTGMDEEKVRTKDTSDLTRVNTLRIPRGNVSYQGNSLIGCLHRNSGSFSRASRWR